MPAGAVLSVLSGCDSPRSALNAAGRSSADILQLSGWLFGGAALIWLIVIGTALYATRWRPREHSIRTANRVIVGGGIVFPVIVLTLMLIYGLQLMPQLMAPGDGLRIAVSGERWWWRVQYRPVDGEPVASANEIRLPLGERVEFELTSPDVIHSFWIPALGGKIDMIPGRTNRLVLEPLKTGTFHGVCAEFCGLAHTQMAFSVVVMLPHEFTAWLEQQAQPALPSSDPIAENGQQLFLNNGGGACHRIRGSAADGVIGPDLTHVGSRLTIGAGTLATGPDAFAHWTEHTSLIKPGVLMPDFAMLQPEQLQAIGVYLAGLK
jgi:cytochrome c oxidase subunit 2